MRYYKEIKDGKIFGYETRTDDIIPENEIEITQEEYEKAILELQKENNIDTTENQDI